MLIVMNEGPQLVPARSASLTGETQTQNQVLSVSTPSTSLIPTYTKRAPYRRPRGTKWIKAVRLLADGKTALQTAHTLGVKPLAIVQWRKSPAFQGLLERYDARALDDAMTRGFANKAKRISSLSKYAEKIETQIEAEPLVDVPTGKEFRATLEQIAKDKAGAFAPGESTGNTTGVAITINYPVVEAAEQAAAMATSPIIDMPPAMRRLGK